MMKQRRRMLANLIDLENLFLNAVYVASGGTDSSTVGMAQISKSLLLNNKKYYLFGYYSNNFAIFTYYNGTITKIYERSTATLNVDLNYAGYCSLSAGGDYTKRSLGLTALSFCVDIDNIFVNLTDGYIGGNEGTSSSLYYLPITNIYKGETKFIFNGISNRFCVYKVDGTTYSDLIPLFNYNLYLILNGTSITSSYNNSTGANHYGYTVFAAKE